MVKTPFIERQEGDTRKGDPVPGGSGADNPDRNDRFSYRFLFRQEGNQPAAINETGTLQGLDEGVIGHGRSAMNGMDFELLKKGR
jgi:hypothetical protein